MTCPNNEKLILLHDGELSERERASVDAHVRSCATCAPILAALSAVRMLTRSAIEAELEQVPFSALTARVMRGIDVERPVALSERIRVWLEEFVTNRRRVWVPAVAFSVMVAMLGGFYQMQPPPAPPDPGGSSVLSIRGTSAAIVFAIPSQDGLSSTAVVWVNDEEEPVGGSGT